MGAATQNTDVPRHGDGLLKHGAAGADHLAHTMNRTSEHTR
jgi:hypothetical protein